MIPSREEDRKIRSKQRREIVLPSLSSLPFLQTVSPTVLFSTPSLFVFFLLFHRRKALFFDERQSLLFCFIFLLFLTRFLIQSLSVCPCHFIRHLSSFYHFFSIRVFTSFSVVFFFSSKGRQLAFCLICFSKMMTAAFFLCIT